MRMESDASEIYLRHPGDDDEVASEEERDYEEEEERKELESFQKYIEKHKKETSDRMVKPRNKK